MCLLNLQASWKKPNKIVIFRSSQARFVHNKAEVCRPKNFQSF